MLPSYKNKAAGGRLLNITRLKRVTQEDVNLLNTRLKSTYRCLGEQVPEKRVQILLVGVLSNTAMGTVNFISPKNFLFKRLELGEEVIENSSNIIPQICKSLPNLY
jgi:hypothetical protein